MTNTIVLENYLLAVTNQESSDFIRDKFNRQRRG